VENPMLGQGLMQTIARVNRVFRDKPGGLVVDYLGLAYNLRRALAIYTQSDRWPDGHRSRRSRGRLARQVILFAVMTPSKSRTAITPKPILDFFAEGRSG
jgi:type I site-specific restriction-modification system R (restriction) subunit